MLLQTTLTAVALLMLAAAALCAVGMLLLPVYLWVRCRDSVNAPAAAAQQADAEALLAEISAEHAAPTPAR